MNETEANELVMAVAFAIEDPCGVEVIELVRALIELGRATPENRRKGVAALCHAKALSFEAEKFAYDPMSMV